MVPAHAELLTSSSPTTRQRASLNLKRIEYERLMSSPRVRTETELHGVELHVEATTGSMQSSFDKARRVPAAMPFTAHSSR
jgi:hypothetical protein